MARPGENRMKSGEHVLWDAHLASGRARADVQAIALALAPAMGVWRRAGVTAAQAIAGMRRSVEALERASITAKETAR